MTDNLSKNNRFVVLANWKMYKTIQEGIDYIRAIKQNLQQFQNTIEVILCASFTALSAVSSNADKNLISIGAQNVHHIKQGEFTGEVSAPMLADAGCRYAMVGHSWRRQYASETDDIVNQKAKALIKAGISPIVCIGETLNERKENYTLQKLERQVTNCFSSFTNSDMMQTIVLYEPVWAIGTGKIATSQEVQENYLFIRKIIKSLFSNDVAMATRIVYGGSVKSHNVSTILNGRDIDGVGIGSDSLNVNNFIRIAKSCAEHVS